MEELANQIFDILKGANYKLRLFTESGIKTINPDEATRFYAYDQGLMISMNINEGQLEVIAQAGDSYDVTKNTELLKAIKVATHKHLGEYTVRKFNKKITPKDFSHQSVKPVVEGFSKAYGTIKTSYVQSPNAKLIIKHTAGVNEEKRGARSRNIHKLFIENKQGEKFAFPYKYIGGARAMTMHVNEGGTPYDSKGKAILSICEDMAELTKFVKHTRANKLVTEDNQNIIDIVRNRLVEHRNIIKSLSTLKGYNKFEGTQTVLEEISEEQTIDITASFELEEVIIETMQLMIQKVNRVVTEARVEQERFDSYIKQLYNIIRAGQLNVAIDKDAYDNPNNLDPMKFSGNHGAVDKLAIMLSYIAEHTTNKELEDLLIQMSGEIQHMSPEHIRVMSKFAMLAMNMTGTDGQTADINESIVQELIFELRKKIA